MATATLVHQGKHRLRYLIEAETTGDETAVISTIGGATPDTLTDAIGSGTINKLSKVVADGYGGFAAGVQTAAKAAALWTSDFTSADPASGSPNGSKLPTAQLEITKRSGSGLIGAYADIDGGGNPRINVAIANQSVLVVAYLDIFVPGTIGV